MKREPTRINAVTYKKAISKNWPHQYHEPRAVFRSCIVRHSSKWRDSILTSPNRLPRSDKIAGSPSLTVLQGCHNGLGGLASMYYAWCRNRRGRERDNKRDSSPMTAGLMCGTRRWETLGRSIRTENVLLSSSHQTILPFFPTVDTLRSWKMKRHRCRTRV